MSYGSKREFRLLRAKIKANKKLTSVMDVLNELEFYFKSIEWSLLKEEWQGMSEDARTQLAQKLFEDDDSAE